MPLKAEIMAGTDNTQSGPGPAIILADPQLGENIGMAARAMLNCGLTDLRLIRPRDGWPNDKAIAAASGAAVVLDGVQLFETTESAIADLGLVYATTARSRHMTKDTITPRRAIDEICAHAAAAGRSGIIFGQESKGLHNDDVALADAVLSIPLNPSFSSLNLAQAVLLLGYEWYSRKVDVPDQELVIPKRAQPAGKAELVGLFKHLEGELDACGFLRVAERRPIMVRNIRNLLQRARLTGQEVRTLRGVVDCLASRPRRER